MGDVMGDSSKFCGAVTQCATASACELHLAPGRVVILAVIVVLPILWSVFFLPLLVGASTGMLVVIVGLAVGFVPTFFFLLLSPHPCTTAIGGCGTISCACGTYYIRGAAHVRSFERRTSHPSMRSLSLSLSLAVGRVLASFLAGLYMTRALLRGRLRLDGLAPARWRCFHGGAGGSITRSDTSTHHAHRGWHLHHVHRNISGALHNRRFGAGRLLRGRL